ncbi:MAG: tryptophan-rich sensory protein [Betaproteobacteria bacterium]|nr:tryptophan-rich sensory protein [Betaproteobacteria bacterium]
MQTKYSIRLFCFLAVGVTALSGALFKPGAWYATLVKPFWTPPNLVFPIAWTALYLTIAVVGILLFEGPFRILKWLWVLQLALNGLWSWLFFGQHWILFGMLDMILLLVTIGWLAVLAFPRNRVAAWLLVPYLVWVSYASTLNLGIFVLNAN